MPYTVSTPVFEGPFDLLLHLINREQVDLWEVSVSSIVDAYLATLEQMRGLDLEVATEFLLIAAILVELKTRRLLPGRSDVEPEEELVLWEERDLLLSRLLEAKTFKDAAGSLVRIMDQASGCYPRTAGLDERFAALTPDILAGVTPDALRSAMEGLLAPRPVARVVLDHVAPIRLSVADAVSELSMDLARLGETTFAALVAGVPDRLEVIVRFLALLEMYKQGSIELSQAGTFAELHVSWLDEGAALRQPVEEYQG
ncbi:MAG: segregation/condensation protein A [Actinomycetota bacterium]|nr:segregation/condensation protein A [Actinomycetota bacterium]